MLLKLRGKFFALNLLLGSIVKRNLLLVADCENLDPLRCHLRVGQSADGGLVENFAQRRRQFGGVLCNRRTYDRVPQTSRKSDTCFAVLEPRL